MRDLLALAVSLEASCPGKAIACYQEVLAEDSANTYARTRLGLLLQMQAVFEGGRPALAWKLEGETWKAERLRKEPSFAQAYRAGVHFTLPPT